MYIAASATIQNVTKRLRSDDPNVETFYKHCRDFLVECEEHIQSRCHIDNFYSLACLSPKVTINLGQPSLIQVISRVPYLKDIVDCQNLDREWRQ